MMKFKELIFVLLLAGGFIIPPLIAQQWWLLSVFLTFFVCFGIIEWIAVFKTDETVSQKVWKLKDKTPWKFWLVISGMAISWIALLWHFIDP